MSRSLVSTGSPFELEIGYSRAVVQDVSDGRWVFVAGTTGYDYATMTMPEDPGEQAKNIFATIERTLGEVGVQLEHLVRVRYYLTDRAHKEQVIPVLGATLGAIRPAATMVIAGLAEPEMKVEIEADAFRPN